MNKNYGWTYDKKGNKVKVSAPITANGKAVKKSTTIKTGGLLGGVGLSSMNSEIISQHDVNILNSLYETSSI